MSPISCIISLTLISQISLNFFFERKISLKLEKIYCIMFIKDMIYICYMHEIIIVKLEGKTIYQTPLSNFIQAEVL